MRDTLLLRKFIYIFFFLFIKAKLCSLVYLSDVPCRQCEVAISSFTPTLGYVMSWYHTHNDKRHLLLCFGTVFLSLPRRNGIEGLRSQRWGMKWCKGTWLLPGSWQGSRTPSIIFVVNRKVFSFTKTGSWGCWDRRGLEPGPGLTGCWV